MAAGAFSVWITWLVLISPFIKWSVKLCPKSQRYKLVRHKMSLDFFKINIFNLT